MSAASDLARPREMQAARAVTEVLIAHGGEWIDPPVLQPAAIYLELAGEDIRSRLYTLTGPDGAELCLRPDLTAPAARHLIAQGGGGARLLYQGLVFRHRAAEAGEEDQFIQIGAETFGESDRPQADADALALALECTAKAGVPEPSVTLGDIGLYGVFIAGLGLPATLGAQLTAALPHPKARDRLLDRASHPTRHSGLADALAGLDGPAARAALGDVAGLAKIQPIGVRSLEDIAARLVARSRDAQPVSPAVRSLLDRYLRIEGPPERVLDAVQALALEARVNLDAALADWSTRLTSLARCGVAPGQITFKTSFARAFDYYDGVLFELEAPELGSAAGLGGGGRYDSLLRRLSHGALDAPAVGLMLRPARLARAAQARR
jgi:ATP phosphoribosyltransferase regulatory subunit